MKLLIQLNDQNIWTMVIVKKNLMGATTHNVIYGTFVIDKGANTDIKCQKVIKLLLDLSFYVNVLEI